MLKNRLIAGSVIAVLAIVFVPHAVRRHAIGQQKAREQLLRSQLASIRSALKTFEARHHAKPHSLSELVRDGVLKGIPVDPITGSASKWQTTLEETVRIDDFSATAPVSNMPQIVDVHSGARGVDSAGRPFSNY